jgi:hypothetical protein
MFVSPVLFQSQRLLAINVCWFCNRIVPQLYHNYTSGSNVCQVGFGCPVDSFSPSGYNIAHPGGIEVADEEKD